MFAQVHSIPVRPPESHDDSYLIVPAFLSQGETDALLTRSRLLLDEFSLQDHPLVRL